MDDLPVDFSTTRTRDAHIADHKRLHRLSWGDVHAAHYQSIIDALADALTKRRPLVLSSGAVYETAQTLSVADLSNVRIQGNGATIRATADLDVLLDHNGMAYSQVDGLNLDTATGITVQDMIRVRWDGVGPRSTANNVFDSVRVRGQYVNGWRIGEPGTGVQCDNLTVRKCGAYGNWTPGETSLWQRGFLVGDGVVGNNVIHHFTDANAAKNRYQFDIDMARHVLIDGASLSLAECDFLVRTLAPLTLRQVRSEGAAQFLRADDRGSEAFYTGITIDGCTFNPHDGNGYTLRPDGRWIEINHGGYLGIRNTAVNYAPEGTPAVIYAHDNALPLYIEARGLFVINTTQAQAFDVAENVTVDCAGYTNWIRPA